MVQQHNVHVAYVEFVDAFLDGWLRIGKLRAGVNLRDDGDILATADTIGDGLSHGTSHLLLIAVHIGGIDKTVAVLQG